MRIVASLSWLTLAIQSGRLEDLVNDQLQCHWLGFSIVGRHLACDDLSHVPPA